MTWEIFFGESRLVLVHGYSTSFGWPERLQRTIERYVDGKRIIGIK